MPFPEEQYDEALPDWQGLVVCRREPPRPIPRPWVILDWQSFSTGGDHTLQHEQQLSPAGLARSVQQLPLTRSIEASPALAAEASRLYWAYLGRCPFLRVTMADDGAVAIRLLGLLLLAFQPPIVVGMGQGWGLRYPISHGAVVHRQHNGEGYLQMGVEPTQVTLAVEGYYPSLVRISPRFYEWTQAVVHRGVAGGYLPRLAAMVSGIR